MHALAGLYVYQFLICDRAHETCFVRGSCARNEACTLHARTSRRAYNYARARERECRSPLAGIIAVRSRVYYRWDIPLRMIQMKEFRNIALMHIASHMLHPSTLFLANGQSGQLKLDRVYTRRRDDWWNKFLCNFRIFLYSLWSIPDRFYIDGIIAKSVHVLGHVPKPGHFYYFRPVFRTHL